MNLKQYLTKQTGLDILAECIGSFLVAVGVYNFAAASDFPFSGISGIALIFWHFFKWPIGVVTAVLNIPIILFTWRILGPKFYLKTFRVMLISVFFTDVIAPLLPMYRGSPMLSAVCLGGVSGLGYALIYMRDSSTGGMDFIIMAVRKRHPHLTLGRIIIVTDFTVVILGGLIMRGNIDLMIYGLIATCILSVVVDKVMYGVDSGKVTLIVTDHGYAVAQKIDEMTQRGATLLRGEGSYSKKDKDVVMCACSNKQMYMVQRAVKAVDQEAFLITMDANQVRGNGFKPY